MHTIFEMYSIAQMVFQNQFTNVLYYIGNITEN